MSALLPHLIRERLHELERTVETLATRVNQLQSHVALSPPPAQGCPPCRRSLWRRAITRSFALDRQGPVRENRRLDPHVVGSTRRGRERP